MRLWLDDVRPMPDDFDVHVTTAPKAIEQLVTGKVTHISLDHDLGEDKHGTGRDVAYFIENGAYFNTLPQLTWAIHSANPVGRENMSAALTNADKYWEYNTKVRNYEMSKSSKTTMSFKNLNQNLDKVFSHLGDAFKNLDEVFENTFTEQSSSESKIVTDDMIVRIEGKNVVINGHVENITLNGQRIAVSNVVKNG